MSLPFPNAVANAHSLFSALHTRVRVFGVNAMYDEVIIEDKCRKVTRIRSAIVSIVVSVPIMSSGEENPSPLRSQPVYGVLLAGNLIPYRAAIRTRKDAGGT